MIFPLPVFFAIFTTADFCKLKPYLLLFLLFTACKKDPKIWESYEEEVYGPYPRNTMDVYLPQEHNSDTEVVILVHAGGWVAGDKRSWPAGFIDIFPENGYALASINYRYACGDFHKQMDDIASAISFIKENAANWNISSTRFALLGASAGGHLSLLYAHAFDLKKDIKTVVSLVGPTDLTDTLFHQYADSYNLTSVLIDLLGGEYGSIPGIYRAASPLYNYSEVPSFFIHGKLDNLVPAQQGVRMFDTLVAAGISADTTILPMADHNVFGPDNIYWDRVCGEIKDWLALYLDE